MDFIENVGRREEVPQGEFGRFIHLGDKSLNGNENNRLYRHAGLQEDGDPVFVDVGYVAGVDRLEDGRAMAVTDVDADGDLDIVVQNFERRAVLLVNQGAPGHWLQLKLVGTDSNRDAVGARVVVEAGGREQTREVRSTNGYLTGCSLWVHFGLADAAEVERVTIHWPSGRVEVLEDVAADRRLWVREGSGVVEPPSPPR